MPCGAISRCNLIAIALLTAAATCAAGTQPPPRGPIRRLRFSPDGRHILALDASAITVLTVSPLAVLFRIPVENATQAQFTPDSQQVIFLSGGTRVNAAQIHLAKSGARLEYWSVPGHASVESHELPAHACAPELLSPDGRFLLCADLLDTLWLIDTASGSTILQKDGFGKNGFAWDGAERQESTIKPARPTTVRMAFSPDAHYFVAAVQEHFVSAQQPDLDRTPKEWWSGRAVVWDLSTGRPVPLKDRLNILADQAVTHVSDERPDRRRSFTFVSPDRLLISDLINAKSGRVTTTLLEFPSGRLLSKPVLPAGPLFPATDPNFVIIRASGRERIDHPQRTIAAELDKQETIVSETPALDVLGRYYIAEPRRGWVGLYERRKGLEAAIDIHKSDSDPTWDRNFFCNSSSQSRFVSCASLACSCAESRDHS